MTCIQISASQCYSVGTCSPTLCTLCTLRTLCTSSVQSTRSQPATSSSLSVCHQLPVTRRQGRRIIENPVPLSYRQTCRVIIILRLTYSTYIHHYLSTLFSAGCNKENVECDLSILLSIHPSIYLLNSVNVNVNIHIHIEIDDNYSTISMNE